MRFGKAVERLVENWQYAKAQKWVRNPVAWALYQTWLEADDGTAVYACEEQRGEQDDTDQVR